jgi:hypothetical protein
MLFFVTFSLLVQGQLQSPEQFLGYKLGERFTPHHRMVDYLYHVKEYTPNSVLQQYGESYEHRPLMMLVFSSNENIGRLEAIRQNNIAKSEGRASNADLDKIAIVWLSYNVHGNESVCMESAIDAIYTLASAKDARVNEWLKNTVVIFDPCINPDGRDRYANFYNQYGNKVPNADLQSMEHDEPWPGGRPNHYLFDLNRDWAWQKQQESRMRLKVYRQWLPHVHADFHEQSLNSPYYFAPAAEPYHKIITDWQREFQVLIAKNTAGYFDKRGSLYFTKEEFDLLYPSYGDTYPTYHGAIGMTYEQGGSGAAGLNVEIESGDSLSLAERILNHYESTLSAIEVSSKNAEKLATEFAAYYKRNRENPWGDYKSYVIPVNDKNRDKTKMLRNFLDLHGFQYSLAPSNKAIQGYSYMDRKLIKTKTGTEDLLISAHQPLSSMLQVLFDPNPVLSDSVTYDITSWALPYAYGLETYALKEKMESGAMAKPVQAETPVSVSQMPYAFIARYTSLNELRFLAELNTRKVSVRMADSPFTLDGKNYERGSLVILKHDNLKLGDKLVKIVAEAAAKCGVSYYAASTGLVEKGYDLGSDHVRFLEIPKVAVAGGSQTSSLAFGEVWYFFEQELGYQVSTLDAGNLFNYDLNKYNVIILPEGYYQMFDSTGQQYMADWVSRGGTLIIMDGALHSFAESDFFSLKYYDDEEEKKADEERSKKLKKTDRFEPYSQRIQNYVRSENPGSVFEVKLDVTHPLAFGYEERYFSLKNSSSRFAFLNNGWNVGYLKDSSGPVSGFSGARAKEKLANSLVFGVEEKGEGHVVYFVDNPLFRGFWENGKLLFGNAVWSVGAK